MTEKPNVAVCPECNGRLEVGFLQAPSAGVLWTTDPDSKWMPIFSSRVEKLQKDWLGFPKLTKDKLPALRCQQCRLVIARYSAGKTESANQPSRPIAGKPGSG